MIWDVLLNALYLVILGDCFIQILDMTKLTHHSCLNPLPVQFTALLHGQKGCVFFSGHLNLRTTPETGLPSRKKKIIKIKLKKTK